jgi:hypothetical protein
LKDILKTWAPTWVEASWCRGSLKYLALHLFMSIVETGQRIAETDEKHAFQRFQLSVTSSYRQFKLCVEGNFVRVMFVCITGRFKIMDNFRSESS